MEKLIPKYYEINEENARLSKQCYSFYDYIPNSATNSYKEQVDYAYSLINDVPDDLKEQAIKLADKYAYKLANNINESFRIEMSCPSILIAGASNFPTRKKEQQNSRRDKNFKEYEYIQEILKKIERLKYYKPKVEHKQKIYDFNLDNEYFKIIQNEELNRLQLDFEEKPDENIRTILKKNGFKWSPNNAVWQRQLTNNAVFSVKIILNEIRKLYEK